MAFVHSTCFLPSFPSSLNHFISLSIYVCVCVCVHTHTPSVFPKNCSFSQQGARMGVRGTVWSETEGKSCRQFFGSSSLSPVSLPCSPLGNNRKPAACIHLRKWQWHRRENAKLSSVPSLREAMQMVGSVLERTHSVPQDLAY